MKVYAWNSEKNGQLIEERNISFEEIVVNIYLGNEVDIFDHPNQARYPGQKISVVVVEDYVYLVPFIETELHQLLADSGASVVDQNMHVSEALFDFLLQL